jgi:hypothetical protein
MGPRNKCLVIPNPAAAAFAADSGEGSAFPFFAFRAKSRYPRSTASPTLCPHPAVRVEPPNPDTFDLPPDATRREMVVVQAEACHPACLRRGAACCARRAQRERPQAGTRFSVFHFGLQELSLRNGPLLGLANLVTHVSQLNSTSAQAFSGAPSFAFCAKGGLCFAFTLSS